jgi:ketopantoate hydroxymethyltransferase
MAIYDYRSAVIADRLGIDILCVSDTGGMILFGHHPLVLRIAELDFGDLVLMVKNLFTQT